MKVCSGCQTAKPETDFNWKVKATGKRMSRCRSCQSEAAKVRWASGSEKASNYASKARRVQRAQDYIWELFQDNSCADCGETDPLVFEFDHLGDKVLSISQMLARNYGLSAIKNEIAKCEIVCANCHKRRTSMRGNHWRYSRLNQA